jgi:hypothetical protein
MEYQIVESTAFCHFWHFHTLVLAVNVEGLTTSLWRRFPVLASSAQRLSSKVVLPYKQPYIMTMILNAVDAKIQIVKSSIVYILHKNGSFYSLRTTTATINYQQQPLLLYPIRQSTNSFIVISRDTCDTFNLSPYSLVLTSVGSTKRIVSGRPPGRPITR